MVPSLGNGTDNEWRRFAGGLRLQAHTTTEKQWETVRS
ncbi:hypothetical protein DC74_2298 [Streptomyces noursei]|uniref:Uncharacterized protein n=1 Tax=Streptomyces noursei TaxID=1971 RepID=A0A059W0M1_STRNR|nr:hypothetical protein DC74_2298 [Streptomyces noursei]GCB90447.1 hypothetical protein SALB_03154 [Streptomyces noursei]